MANSDTSNFHQGPPPSATIRREGVVITSGSWLGVSVDGNPISARYADPLVLRAGDPVLVDISASGPYGQSQAYVLCRLTGAPRPGNGKVTVVPASSQTISVLGDDGVTYTAKFVSSYTPVVNDPVTLNWNASVPTVVGKTTTTPAPTPPAPVVQPPSSSSSGSKTYPASDSATYSSFGWDAWAGGGGNLYQGGAAYGGPTFGAWFYNAQTAELAGRTITRVQLRLGARRHVGNYNQPVSLNLYTHNNASRPGGDVTRVAGPFPITIQPNQGPTTVDLFGALAPVASALQGGGGLCIAGEPYAGLEGRYSQPDSGALTIDWSR